MADYPVKGHWFSIQVLMPVLCLLVVACSTSHRIEDSFFVDGLQGAVSLQNVDDASFRTAHPVSVSPQLLTHILRGAQALPDETSTAMHVFSDDETKFLSPLISAALSQATQKQLVTFRVIRGESTKKEVVDGTIYIRGRLLHLTLTGYQGRPHKGGSDHEQNYASCRLGEVEPPQLAFIPETDWIPRSDEQRVLIIPPPLGALIIDYTIFSEASGLFSQVAQSQLLHSGSTPCPKVDIPSLSPNHGVAALQETPPDSSGEVLALKEVVCEQAMELDILKQEMHVLRHMLSEIETRKRNVIKPELAPGLRTRIRNRIIGLTLDSTCNSVCRPLHSKNPWLSDIFIENKLKTHLLTFNISRVFLKAV